MLICSGNNLRRSQLRIIWTSTVLVMFTAWANPASAGVSNATLTYGADSTDNSQVTLSVDNNNGSGSDWFAYFWYQFSDRPQDCIESNFSFDDTTANNDEYTERDKTYSKVIKGNDGKYICVGGIDALSAQMSFRAFGPIKYPPKFSNATVEGQYLVINFDNLLNTNMTPPASVFTVAGVLGVTVSSFTLSSTSAVLTLSKTIASNDTITVTYLNLSAASFLEGANGSALANFSGKPVTNRSSETLSVTGGYYYLKNRQGAFVEIPSTQTVTALQGETKSSIYTKVVFNKSVKHVESSGASARPLISYTMDGSEKQYEIVAGSATLASGQCQPYSGSFIPFKEYLCRYTVKTGRNGDDGNFDFDVGSATEDQHSNTLGSRYSHASNVYVDAKTPTVNSTESGYYTTYDKNTGAVSGKFTSCSALSSGTDIYMKYVFSEPIRYTSDRTESSIVFPVLMVGVGSNLTKFANKPKGYDIQSGQCAPASSSPVSTVVCRHTATTAHEPITMRATNSVADIHMNHMSGSGGWAHRNALSSSGAATLSWSIRDLTLAQNAQMTALTLPKAQCDTTGNGTYTYSLAPKGSGSLPTGLTFNSHPTVRTLSGTPTVIQDATTYTYTVTGNNQTDSQDFDIAVTLPPEIEVIPNSLQLVEGERGSFAVSLMSPPQGGDVMLELSTDNGKITVQPDSITFTGSDWAVAQTVTVVTVPDDDSVSENAKVIMNPSGANYESIDNVEPKVEVIESPVVSEGRYYLKNDRGSLIEITSGQTVSGFQKEVPSAIYTKVVFSKSVKHVAATGSTARPNITYTMAPGSAIQYEIVDGTAVLGDGQCQPYSDSVAAFQEYLCRYTVTTGNSGDDGDFYFGVGSTTEDRHGNSLVSDYKHPTTVDVDARSPTVKTAESGYYLKNEQGGLVEIITSQTVTAFQGATKTSIYTRVVFSESVRHVAAGGSTARPHITYTMAPGSAVQYEIVDGTAVLDDGQCQPYAGSTVPFGEYLCRYTVTIGNSGDDGDFNFGVGSATEDLSGNTLSSNYTHSGKVDVDARSHAVNAAESGYYLKNDQGNLIEITSGQTVSGFQKQVPSAIYTKVVFRESVRHVAASGAAARPNITYTMAPGSSVQYEIVDGTAVLGDGQCQPYSGSVATFQEYLCRYTVKTGNSGDDGDFGFGVGSATDDLYGNRVSLDYTHGTTVDVDARSPTVNSTQSGYYTTYNKDTGAVSSEFNSCSALSSGTDIYMKYVFSEPIRYTSDRTESSIVFPVLMVGVGSNLTKFANKPKGYDIQSGQCAPASSSPVSTVVCRHTATTAHEPITMRATNAVADIHKNLMSGSGGWIQTKVHSTDGHLAISESISDHILTQDVAMTTLTLPKASCDSGDGNYTYSLTAKGSGLLPDGLTFDSTATVRTLSGTPTTAQDATGYTYTVTGNSLTNSLEFNITVLPRPAISVVPESLQLLEGESGSFAVSLMSPPQGGDVTLQLSTDNGKITVQPSSIIFTGTNWAVAQTVTVVTVPDDDSVSENAKVIMNPSGANYQSLDNVEPSVTVIESDNESMKAWIVQFGMTIANQLQSAVKDRLQSVGTPGIDVTVAGQPVNLSNSGTPTVQVERNGNSVMPDIGNDQIAHVQSMKLDEALSQSTFAMTGKPDSANGSFGLWGQVAQTSFEDSVDMTDIDGDVTTGILGADYSVGDSVAGAIVSRTSATGGYNNDENKFNASLNAATLYWSNTQSERVNLWGLAGFGEGSMSLMQMNAENIDTDISWRMMALGIRGTLREHNEQGSPKLDLVSDAIWARTSTDKTAGLTTTSGTSKRLRVGLESSWTVKQEDGGSLTTTLEGVLRHDSGDASTGLGIQLGAGAAWQSPKTGLSIDVFGHGLIAHEDGNETKDYGFSAGLNFDRTPNSGHGPSFSVHHNLGAVTRAGDAFHTTNQLSSIDTEPAMPRWSVESAWGFPVMGGHYTGSPYTELGLSGGQRDYTVGWRLAPETSAANDFTFEVFTTRREAMDSAPEQSIWIAARARW